MLPKYLSYNILGFRILSLQFRFCILLSPPLNSAASTPSYCLTCPKAEDKSLLLPSSQWSVFSNPLKTTSCLWLFPHLSCRQTQHQFLLLPWEHLRVQSSGSLLLGTDVVEAVSREDLQDPSGKRLYRKLPTSPHLSIGDKSSPTETARISH